MRSLLSNDDPATVTLSTRPVDAEVLIDGRPLLDQKASPFMAQGLAAGTSHTLTVRKAGGEALEYLIIKMEHILITGCQTTGSDGQDQLVEQVSLNFKRVGMTYTPQLDDGTGGPEVAGGWDIGGNLAWEP